jgi:hypothetical protein
VSLLKKLDRALMHPVTVVSVLLGAVGSLVNIPIVSAIVWTAWAKAGTVFAAVSVLVSQGWIPEGTGQAAMLVAGSLFLGRLGTKLWDGIERRLDK